MIKVSFNLTEKELESVNKRILLMVEDKVEKIVGEICERHVRCGIGRAQQEMQIPLQELTSYVKKIHKNQDYLIEKLNELERRINDK